MVIRVDKDLCYIKIIFAKDFGLDRTQRITFKPPRNFIPQETLDKLLKSFEVCARKT